MRHILYTLCLCLIATGCKPAAVAPQLTIDEVREEMDKAVKKIPVPIVTATADTSAINDKLEQVAEEIKSLKAKPVPMPVENAPSPQVKAVSVPPVSVEAAAPAVKLAQEVIFSNLNDRGELIVWAQTRPTDCAPCKLWHIEKGLARIGDQPIEWRYMSECPKDFQIDGFPFFAWQSPDGKWWTTVGWWNPQTFEKTVQRSMTGQVKHLPMKTTYSRASEVPKAYGNAPPVQQVYRTVRYSTPYLTVPPLAGGEHAGKFDTGWLSQLSWEELQSLHSDDHEHRVQWQFVVRPGMRSARVTAPIAPVGTFGQVTYRSTVYAAPVRSYTTYTSPALPVYAPVYAAQPVMAAPMAQRTRTVSSGGGLTGMLFGSHSRTTTTIAPPNSRAFGGGMRRFGGGCPGGVCPL